MIPLAYLAVYLPILFACCKDFCQLKQHFFSYVQTWSHVKQNLIGVMPVGQGQRSRQVSISSLYSLIWSFIFYCIKPHKCSEHYGCKSLPQHTLRQVMVMWCLSRLIFFTKQYAALRCNAGFFILD